MPVTDNIIWDIQIGEDEGSTKIASSAYTLCNTGASEPTKEAVLSGFTRCDRGVTVRVKFANTNTAANPYLQISSSGAHPIKLYDDNNAPMPTWPAGAIVSFTYDGTNWVMNTGHIIDRVTDTYDGTSHDPISGKGVKDAIDALDKDNITGFGASKTLKTLTETNGIINATFQEIAIGESQVTNLTTHLDEKAPKNNPEFTGIVTLPSINDESGANVAATKAYVDSKSAGLTGAMHYIPTIEDENHTIVITKTAGINGAPDSYTISGTGLPNNYSPTAGDIIIHNHQEYVYGNSTIKWRLLGDEGSYALKTKTNYAIKYDNASINYTRPTLNNNTFTYLSSVNTQGTIASLTKDPITITNGTAPTFQVNNGTLMINPGVATLSSKGTFDAVGEFDGGAMPTFTSVNNQTVGIQGGNAELDVDSIEVVIP